MHIRFLLMVKVSQHGLALEGAAMAICARQTCGNVELATPTPQWWPASQKQPKCAWTFSRFYFVWIPPKHSRNSRSVMESSDCSFSLMFAGPLKIFSRNVRFMGLLHRCVSSVGRRTVFFKWVTFKMVEGHCSIAETLLSEMCTKHCQAIEPSPKAIMAHTGKRYRPQKSVNGQWYFMRCRGIWRKFLYWRQGS